MRTTLNITITVESNVDDGYDLRDSVAAAFLGVKQTWLSETDDTRIEFQIVKVEIADVGLYEFTPTQNISDGGNDSPLG